MECYSEETIAIFVDHEVSLEEARQLRDHLVSCERCRKLVDALRAESRVLGESLHELTEEATEFGNFPRSRWSSGWADLVIMAGVLALGSVLSAAIDKLSIPQTLEWLNPFSVSGLNNLILSLSYYSAHGGTAMFADFAAIVGGFSLLLLVGGSALVLGRRSQLPHQGLRLLIVLLAFSLPSFALERRHSELVTVPANETVDDTLLATGNIVRVDGVVDGDLLVFARSVEVRGSVKGDLVSFAKKTVVSGTVEGRIYNFSQSLDLNGQLGHSIYAWVQSLRMDSRGRVGEGIVVGASDVSLEGEVKRSATLFAANADVSGTIGRDLTMAVESLTVTDGAKIGGNLTARVHRVNDVHIADGATITGKRDIQARVRPSRFSRPRFYFYQAVWLASAMLVGWLGIAVFPGFFQSSTQAVGSIWRSIGLGFGILVGVPVAIIVAAITLVGIPISLMLFAVYMAAIYLAKIWVGAFLGQMVLNGVTKRNWLLGLLVGLLILTLVGFVPYLGGLVRLAVVCVGLGAFAWQLYTVSRPVITA